MYLMSVVHNLQKFMLTTENLNSFFLKAVPLKKQTHSKIIKKREIYKKSLLIPKFEDTLFWCFFIIKYGISKYMVISHNFKEEQKEKIALVLLIREKKDKLKRKKYKRIKTENAVLYEKKMSISTFLCLCFLHDFNVMIIDNNKYAELISYEQKDVVVIRKQNDQYGIYSSTKEEIESLREKYWKIEDFSKPLKSMSSYKAKDLRIICKKLNINIYNDKNKILNMKKLYKLISEKI